MNRDPLPLGWRAAIAVAASGLTALLYLVPNHYPPSAPVRLPLTWVDQAVPFLPDTAWIYFTDYFLVFTAFSSLRAATAVLRFSVAFLAMVLAGFLVHTLYPTTYPRELFPITDAALPFTQAVFERFRWVDTPTSCFPSMHVACSYFSAFALRDLRLRTHYLFVGWATLVAASTLTTKQHYAVDILAGLALSGAVWAVFYRWLPGRFPHLARAHSRWSQVLFGSLR